MLEVPGASEGVMIVLLRFVLLPNSQVPGDQEYVKLLVGAPTGCAFTLMGEGAQTVADGPGEILNCGRGCVFTEKEVVYRQWPSKIFTE